MSDIGRARKEISQIAETIEASGDAALAKQLRDVLELMKRTKYVRRARAHSNAVTPTVKAKILKLANDHPDMHQSEIASQLGINPGRVSEVLQGRR